MFQTTWRFSSQIHPAVDMRPLPADDGRRGGRRTLYGHLAHDRPPPRGGGPTRTLPSPTPPEGRANDILLTGIAAVSGETRAGSGPCVDGIAEFVDASAAAVDGLPGEPPRSRHDAPIPRSGRAHATHRQIHVPRLPAPANPPIVARWVPFVTGKRHELPWKARGKSLKIGVAFSTRGFSRGPRRDRVNEALPRPSPGLRGRVTPGGGGSAAARDRPKPMDGGLTPDGRAPRRPWRGARHIPRASRDSPRPPLPWPWP